MPLQSSKIGCECILAMVQLVMHRYHFLATDTDTDTFRQKMADTDSMLILWYTNITHQ